MDIHKDIEDTQRKAFDDGRKVPSARILIQCMGYDLADNLGIAEPYRDAWGVNMNRPENAWDKWQDVYPNSVWFDKAKERA